MIETTVLARIDWIVIATILVVCLGICFLFRDDSADSGVEGFFTANRKAKWWFLGTSIAATTFASDTPLVISGWIADFGIAGNWFWWGGAAGISAITVFFARVWRLSGVVTDTEIAELRYGGKPATVLRTSKAFIFSILVNCIILGWVLAGMSKITEPFMDWEYILGSDVYAFILAYYPRSLIFHDINASLTIFTLLLITLTYSSWGGLKAILITDFLWFALAMCMAILLCVYAVDHVGGLANMWERLETLYPSNSQRIDLDGKAFLNHEQLKSFAPSFESGSVGSLGIPFSAFILTLTFMWWTNGNVDGAGYFAQRLYSAENSREAERGAMWYGFAHFVLRSWPWVIAGIVALVMYPRADVNQTAMNFNRCLDNPAQCTTEETQCLADRFNCSIKEYGLLVRKTIDSNEGERIEFREDRERSYPALIKDVLPKGLVGLALVALMGAFMSTVSTHINWGASYIANDFYLRFINPNATNRSLTLVSRLATLGIAVIAILVASQIENVGTMWELYLGMMAGLGLPHLMRWFWWRANAWTELSGMISGIGLALANYVASQNGFLPENQISVFPSSMASHPIHVICWISVVSATISIIATLITPAVDKKTLIKFVEKTKPMGFWNDLNTPSEGEQKDQFGLSVVYFFLGCIGLYAGMFGLGYLIRLETSIGLILIAVSALTLILMLRGLTKLQTKTDVA